jgi:hypothetical protein
MIWARKTNMNATKKSTLAALNLVQSNSAEATASALLARILDLETVASDVLIHLRQDEADAEAAALTAAANPVAPVNAAKIAELQAQLDALKKAYA